MTEERPALIWSILLALQLPEYLLSSPLLLALIVIPRRWVPSPRFGCCLRPIVTTWVTLTPRQASRWQKRERILSASNVPGTLQWFCLTVGRCCIVEISRSDIPFDLLPSFVFSNCLWLMFCKYLLMFLVFLCLFKTRVLGFYQLRMPYGFVVPWEGAV
jgi:hypothetical protein